MAKTQNPVIQEMCFDKLIIPSLEDLVNGDRKEMLLCLVRTAKHYLSGTEQCRPACSSFFLSLWRKKCVTKNNRSLLRCIEWPLTVTTLQWEQGHTKWRASVRLWFLRINLQSSKFWGLECGSSGPCSPHSTSGMSSTGQWIPSSLYACWPLNRSFNSIGT